MTVRISVTVDTPEAQFTASAPATIVVETDDVTAPELARRVRESLKRTVQELAAPKPPVTNGHMNGHA